MIKRLRCYMTVRYLVYRLNSWQRRIDKSEDLRTAWIVFDILCGAIYRLGYVLTFDSISRKWHVS